MEAGDMMREQGRALTAKADEHAVRGERGVRRCGTLGGAWRGVANFAAEASVLEGLLSVLRWWLGKVGGSRALGEFPDVGQGGAPALGPAPARPRPAAPPARRYTGS